MKKWCFWEKLKERHSRLHVNVGIVPFWWGSKDQAINMNAHFKNWFYSNKDWITPILHGYRHDHPYGPFYGEFEGTYVEQQNMLSKALKIFREFKEDIWGFIPPFWRYNEHTLRVLQEANCSYVISNRKIKPLKPTRHSTKPFVFLPTHCNVMESNPDDVEAVYARLDALFTRHSWEFLNMNEFMRGA